MVSYHALHWRVITDLWHSWKLPVARFYVPRAPDSGTEVGIPLRDSMAEIDTDDWRLFHTGFCKWITRRRSEEEQELHSVPMKSVAVIGMWGRLFDLTVAGEQLRRDHSRQLIWGHGL